jgi:hypothetical protein
VGKGGILLFANVIGPCRQKQSVSELYIFGQNLLLISRSTSVFDLLLPTGLAADASVLHSGSGDAYGPGNLANRLELASID